MSAAFNVDLPSPVASLVTLDQWLQQRALKLHIASQGRLYFVRLVSRLKGDAWEGSSRQLDVAVLVAIQKYERAEGN